MRRMYMTDEAICKSYREAKNRAEQIEILKDMNCTTRSKIIKILVRNGYKVRIAIPSKGMKKRRELTDDEYQKALYRRLDVLDANIAKLEDEFRDILAVLGVACGEDQKGANRFVDVDKTIGSDMPGK